MDDASQQVPVPAQSPGAYPVRYDVAYSETLSRSSTFFRIILAIPVLLFVAILDSGDLFSANGTDDAATFSIGALGSLILCHWIVILLRKRPVGWLWDAIVNIQRFSLRATSYLALLVDKYPAFEGDWLVTYEVDRPESLTRWKVLVWKVITAIPHFIILIGLFLAGIVVTIIAWFAILFTGAYPRGLFNFVVGSIRWSARVYAYVASLTDEYPPFSLD
jgi:hypothetical protein